MQISIRMLINSDLVDEKCDLEKVWMELDEME